MTPSDYVRAIGANVQAFYADALTYEAFSQKQRELWDAVKRAGATDEVNRLLRQAPASVR